MGRPKHMPLDQWPAADHAAFQTAYEPADVLEDARGPGAHLSKGTRRMIQTVYSRWLGFLRESDPGALLIAPAERLSSGRMQAFVERLMSEVRPTSVAFTIHNILHAA